MELTKKQFRAQFRYKVSFAKCSIKPTYSHTHKGYKIFRALQLLVLQDNGQFFAAHLF